MSPSFVSSAVRVAVVAYLLCGCGSGTLGGGTGTAGAHGDTGGTTGAAGSGGMMATGGTTGVGGMGGTGRDRFICIYPQSARCPSLCGNGVRDACYYYLGDAVDCDNSFVEWCDGADLGNATCESRGLGTGTLRCTSDCVFDTSGCSDAGGGSGGAAGGGGAG
jgi:hypothetical protein